MLSDTADVAAGPAGMTDTERGLCHQVLYDFFHGRIKNPIEAGKKCVFLISIILTCDL